jgi:ASC-1-like (ASCH) protein
MTEHISHLHIHPYKQIESGLKTYEARVNDEKRQTFQVGDTYLFINRNEPYDTLHTTINGLHHYKDFHDLFTHIDPQKFGGTSIEERLKEMNKYYSVLEQQKYGVVGIEFKLIVLDVHESSEVSQ